MKNIKERIIKKQYVAVILFLGIMLVMVIRMGKNIKTSEIKSSIEMKTQDELGEKFAAEYIGFNMDDSASESGVETEALPSNSVISSPFSSKAFAEIVPFSNATLNTA